MHSSSAVARLLPAGVVRLVLISMCLLVPAAAFTAPDSKGTDFWLMFHGNFSTPVPTLFITSDVNTSGVVEVPGVAFSQPFNVIANTVTTVILPAAVDIQASDVVEDRGIHVTSVDEVTVYGLSREPFTTDAFLGLPVDVLGTDYINLGYRNVNVLNGTQFGLVATEDNTTVTITPTETTGARVAGVPYNVAMSTGETYMLRNTGSAPADLSGTTITSDKPIAVFGGHKCSNIPAGETFCDHINEQLPPTSAWGSSFLTRPLATRIGGDTFRFMASVDGTDVTVNGGLVATLNRGQYHEMIINGSSEISATEPILVAQYSNSTSFDGVTSDPFMMLIPPFEQFLGGYTMTTPASGFALNFINIVASTSDAGNITVDGVPIPAGDFTPIGASGFSEVAVPVALGAHTLAGTLPFGAFAYGFNEADSYGYPGGLSLAPIAQVTTVSLSPDGGTCNVGEEHCVTALVLDQDDNPLEGVRVDFDVTGANPTSGFAFTDINGEAVFCYTGLVGGVDTIVGSVGDLADTVTKTWIDNLPPVAVCQDVTIDADGNCEATVAGGANVDGGSFDPDGDPITLVQEPAGPYGLGDTDVLLIVSDGQAADTCEATVTVVDNTPPVITVVLDRDALWPPNHKMVEICATVIVTDNCDNGGGGSSWELISATSDEPDNDNGVGDGNTVDDIQGADLGTADAKLLLRSERQGTGDGRKYTLVWEATDGAGNTSQATACVEVPHDQRGNAMAAAGISGGFVEDAAVIVTLVIAGTPAQRAEDIDVARVFLGHQAAAIRPLGTSLLEQTGDGRKDLVAHFQGNLVRSLEASAPNGSGGKMGLHYTSEDGFDHYLVKNVLGLEAIDLVQGRDGSSGGDENEDVAQDGIDPGAVNADEDEAFVGQITVEVFTVTGRRIRTFDRVGLPEDVRLGWDGRDATGRIAPSGIYFYRVSTPDRTFTRKIAISR